MKNNISRNSKPELIKLFAMLGIICSHAALPPQTSEFLAPITSLSKATTSLQQFTIIIFNYLAQIGNCLFVVCSSYYLIESKVLKKSKILHIIADYSTISIVTLCIFLIAGYSFPNAVVIKQIFPIIFNNNWFIGCYLLLYAIHPFLNTIIHTLNKRSLFCVTFIFLFLFSIVPFIPSVSYINSSIISFVLLYFVTAYIKLHMPDYSKNGKANVIALLMGILGLLALILFTNLLGLKVSAFSDKLLSWSYFANPLIILISISAVNLATYKPKFIKPINYLSSMTLLIYIIHCNRLVMDYLKVDYYRYVSTHFAFNYPIIWLFIYAFSAAVISILLSVLYKELLQPHVHRLYERIFKVFLPLTKKIIDKITSIS